MPIPHPQHGRSRRSRWGWQSSHCEESDSHRATSRTAGSSWQRGRSGDEPHQTPHGRAGISRGRADPSGAPAVSDPSTPPPADQEVGSPPSHASRRGRSRRKGAFALTCQPSHQSICLITISLVSFGPITCKRPSSRACKFLHKASLFSPQTSMVPDLQLICGIWVTSPYLPNRRDEISVR